MSKHEIPDSDRTLAEKYHSHAVDAFLENRDVIVRQLAFKYGGAETRRLTGWSRPTIAACIERVEARIAKGEKVDKIWAKVEHPHWQTKQKAAREAGNDDAE